MPWATDRRWSGQAPFSPPARGRPLVLPRAPRPKPCIPHVVRRVHGSTLIDRHGRSATTCTTCSTARANASCCWSQAPPHPTAAAPPAAVFLLRSSRPPPDPLPLDDCAPPAESPHRSGRPRPPVPHALRRQATAAVPHVLPRLEARRPHRDRRRQGAYRRGALSLASARPPLGARPEHPSRGSPRLPV